MAFTDNTTGGRTILQGIGPVQIAITDTVKPGDLIGLNSSGNWVRADGNSSPAIGAKFIAGQAGVSGDTITAYAKAVIGGVSGAAKGDRVFLSDTAGQYASSASATLRQQVGIALTATEALIEPSIYGESVLSEKRVAVSADKTLVLADSGIVQLVDTDAKVITIPATHVGDCFTIENAGADAAVLVAISPQAADKISGAGLTATDNKDLLNTKATAKRGDRVVLLADGLDGFVVVSMTGIWAREA